MKINYLTLSRYLIALLFVVAGIGKIANFNSMVSMMSSNFGALATVVTILVIVIEIPVAIAYAYGKWKGNYMNYVLIAFTIAATVMIHLIPSVQAQGMIGLTDVNVLKNLAIIGGLIATLHYVHNRA